MYMRRFFFLLPLLVLLAGCSSVENKDGHPVREGTFVATFSYLKPVNSDTDENVSASLATLNASFTVSVDEKYLLLQRNGRTELKFELVQVEGNRAVYRLQQHECVIQSEERNVSLRVLRGIDTYSLGGKRGCAEAEDVDGVKTIRFTAHCQVAIGDVNYEYDLLVTFN